MAQTLAIASALDTTDIATDTTIVTAAAVIAAAAKITKMAQHSRLAEQSFQRAASAAFEALNAVEAAKGRFMHLSAPEQTKVGYNLRQAFDTVCKAACFAAKAAQLAAFTARASTPEYAAATSWEAYDTAARACLCRMQALEYTERI